MTYREAAAPPALRAHVACVWAKVGHTELVLPDGCVDIVWTGARLVVAGPSTQAFCPDTEADVTAVGIRFRVGAAGAVLGVPAAELADRSPRLGELWAGGAELEERCGGAARTGERVQLLLGAVGARIDGSGEGDAAVRRAVLQIGRQGRSPGEIDCGLSPRQLRRRFHAAVGYSPATLRRILRLQRFLRLARHGGTLASLATTAGYADQPHLDHDCRRLTGLSPRELVARRAGPAGEAALTSS